MISNVLKLQLEVSLIGLFRCLSSFVDGNYRGFLNECQGVFERSCKFLLFLYFLAFTALNMLLNETKQGQKPLFFDRINRHTALSFMFG
jgi:hypothetical protein